jgi:hypothetical protein
MKGTWRNRQEPGPTDKGWVEENLPGIYEEYSGQGERMGDQEELKTTRIALVDTACS